MSASRIDSAFGGCSCSLGLSECSCTAACELPEPIPTVEAEHPLLWLLYGVAIVAAIAVCAWLKR